VGGDYNSTEERETFFGPWRQANWGKKGPKTIRPGTDTGKGGWRDFMYRKNHKDRGNWPGKEGAEGH